jgi:hypothetical protein
MTPKWQSPRRLSQPVAKARPSNKEDETAKRKLAAQSSLARHRRRGYRRSVR